MCRACFICFVFLKGLARGCYLIINYSSSESSKQAVIFLLLTVASGQPLCHQGLIDGVLQILLFFQQVLLGSVRDTTGFCVSSLLRLTCLPSFFDSDNKNRQALLREKEGVDSEGSALTCGGSPGESPLHLVWIPLSMRDFKLDSLNISKNWKNVSTSSSSKQQSV